MPITNEAAFEARFARRLVEIGYPIDRFGTKGWELAGIDRTTVRKFSRRTEQIEEVALERGITDPKEKAELGAKTRQKKSIALNPNDLKEIWRSWLDRKEEESIERLSVGRAVSHAPGMDVDSSLRHAIDHVFERRSVVPEREVMAEALRRGVGTVSVEQVHASVRNSSLLTKEIEGRRMSTTTAVLEEEERMVAFAREGRGVCRRLAPDAEIKREWLSDEQRKAVRHVFTSTDRVMSVRGAAGAGKTSLMQEAVEGIESAGTKVHVFAPTAQASRKVLRDEGFMEAETVARLLEDPSMHQKVKGSVLWINEAGLLGTRDLGRVFDLAREQDCRIVLSGDVQQHRSVTRGDALRVLEQQAGIVPVELTSIRRQKGEYRAAVQRLSEGTPEGTRAGFQKLDKLGVIQEEPDRAKREDRIVTEYVEALRRGKSVLAISPTHLEGEQTTHRIRKTLRDAGRLGNEEQSLARFKNLNWTAAEKADPSHYTPGLTLEFVRAAPGFKKGERYEILPRAEDGTIPLRLHAGASGKAVRCAETRHLPIEHAERFQVHALQEWSLAQGDRIKFTQNGVPKEGRHRLNNGAVYECAGFTPEGDVRLANGWIVSRDYGHWGHGFVETSHSAQGKTVDVVLVAQSTQSLPATSREQWYVSCSRGRERLLVLTDDKEALREAIVPSGERLSAIELKRESERKTAETLVTRDRQQRIVADIDTTRWSPAQPEGQPDPWRMREATHER